MKSVTNLNLKISGEYKMDGKIIGFIVWAIVGCFIIGIGISAFFRKKAVGFWANIKGKCALLYQAAM